MSVSDGRQPALSEMEVHSVTSLFQEAYISSSRWFMYTLAVLCSLCWQSRVKEYLRSLDSPGKEYFNRQLRLYNGK